MKCAFCDSVWKTRKARGTRSVFSWTAAFLWLLWIVAACLAVFFGIAFFHRQTAVKTAVETSSVSRVSFETVAESVETRNETATPESASESVPNEADSSDGADTEVDLSPADELNPYKDAGNLDFRTEKPERLFREEASLF